MKEREQFLKLPYNLLRSGGYVSKDGECVKMNLTEKIIYTHLRNRYDFFTAQGKEYYDTQKDVADVCNMDIKAVGNVLRKFTKAGLTTIYKKTYGNFVKNVYTSVPVLNLWYKGEAIVPQATGEIEYEIPENFVVNLPDVGYTPEYDNDRIDERW